MTGRDPNETRERDQVVLSRLAKIQHKVDSLEQTTAFALRADKDKHLALVEQMFNKSTERARVYLAANGSRNVQAIADHLGMRKQNVSVALRELWDHGLLDMVEGTTRGTVWTRTSIGRTLRVPQFLCERFNLDLQGKPTRAKQTKVSARGKKGR